MNKIKDLEMQLEKVANDIRIASNEHLIEMSVLARKQQELKEQLKEYIELKEQAERV